MRYIQRFANSNAVQTAIAEEALGKPYIAYLNDEHRIDWNSISKDYRSMPLTIEALSAGTLQLTNNTSQTDIYYNLNDGGWELIGTDNMSFNLQAGDIIQFGATEAVDLQQYSAGRNLFSGNTLVFKVYGNIESLEYGYDNFINQDTSVYLVSAFTYCFRGCTGLTDASNLVLPATTLADYCYRNMFQNCTSLTQAPALPATTLANYCYQSMFYGCTSLTSAPELPAETLAESCYISMFRGCTSLTEAPELPATRLASGCYRYMFQDCTSLTSAPALPATTLTFQCYGNMFQGCTSLTRAPKLPAEALADSCYQSMFQGCTSLTEAPELPATTLTTYCYYSMFKGCTNLNYIKCLATDISAATSHAYWVSGVASSGTFVKAASMTGWSTGIDGIPNNWTVEDADI